MSFDIVIPVGPNDYEIIKNTIMFTKKNVKDYRNIFIISKIDFNLSGTIFISEDIFPFSIESISTKIGIKHRAGWYLQQLIKLTAGLFIPNILESYLVLDSDLFVLKPLTFLENNMYLFCYGSEYHKYYFEHMARLHPSLERQRSVSGICHHMIYNRNYLNELFKLVENYKQMPFMDAFITEIRDDTESGASEYEMYFNFMLKYHPDKIIIRDLKWHNLRNFFEVSHDMDYAAIHHYSRNQDIDNASALIQEYLNK